MDRDERIGLEVGKYVVTRRLGRGGMGVVYEARDKVLRRPVAIKFFAEAAAVTPESVKRFVLEAQAAARLNHPNVVSVYEVGRRENTYFLVMERVPGGSAEEHLRRHGKFPWREATTIAAAACRGLAAAHAASLIHRDVKPANLLLSEDRSGAAGMAAGVAIDVAGSIATGVAGGGSPHRWHVKLSDFGLAKLTDGGASMATAADRVLGTPHYMSPEQCRSEALDPRTDLYSLGATYYSLLTGRPPFGGDLPMQVMFAHCWSPAPDPRLIDASIPAACAAVVKRAMAKDPRDRYRSAGEMMAELESVLLSPDASPAGVRSLPPAVATTSAPPDRWPSDAGDGIRAAAAKVEAILSSRAMDPALSSAPAAALLGETPSAAGADTRAHRSRRPRRWLVASLLLATFAVGGVGAGVWKLGLSRHGRDRPGPGDGSNAGALDTTPPTSSSSTTLGPPSLGDSRWTFDAGGSVSTVTFSPDGRRLAATVSDGAGGIRAWDMADGRAFCSTWRGRPFRGAAFSFDPEGRTLYVGQGAEVLQWSFVQEARRNFPVPADGEVRSLAWSADGRVLAVVAKPPGPNAHARVKLFDSDDKPLPFPNDSAQDVLAACFLGRGGLLAAGGTDAVLRLYSVAPFAGPANPTDAPAPAGARLLRTINAEVAVTSLASSRDGRTLAVGGRQSIQFFDSAGVRRARAFRPDHNVRSLALSPDGALAAAGSGGGEQGDVALFDARTGAVVAELAGHRAAVDTVAFSPDGRLLATGGADHAVKVWDLQKLLAGRQVVPR